jgi:hypothetical protein
LVLVKGGCQTGPQVNGKEKEKKKTEKERNQKKKKVRFLDEWIIQQVKKTSFLYKAYYAKH